MREALFARGALLSWVVRSYLSSGMKKVVCRLRILPQMNELFLAFRVREQSAVAVSERHFSNHQEKENSQPARDHLPSTSRQSSNGGGWDDGRNRNKFPLKLMDVPERIAPCFVTSFRNKHLSSLIRAYHDATFTLQGFLEAAVQAASIVSQYISEGNFEDLKELVVYEAIVEIQNNYGDLSPQQRRGLHIKPEKLFAKFVYEIRVMFDGHTNQRFLEVTVVLHGCHLEETPNTWSEFFIRVGETPEKFYVANYSFIRKFTEGMEDSWTINKLNHFQPFLPPEDEDGASFR